jgi:hypothetical protein
VVQIRRRTSRKVSGRFGLEAHLRHGLAPALILAAGWSSFPLTERFIYTSGLA